ncbi:unnamed protein product [Dovyalis caffra]|uniref:Uncharacterized protein n=1 Tax=Dovyalis caffra TaxID=77055 RepID=A0AAV1SCQ9_9ROSI|nr:unnamed protein product [Dovyalis caffra]
MSKVADHLICEKFQMKAYEETCGEHKTSDGAGPQIPKQVQNNIIDRIKVKAPVNQMPSHEGDSVDMVEEFVSAFKVQLWQWIQLQNVQPTSTRRNKESPKNPNLGHQWWSKIWLNKVLLIIDQKSKKPKKNEEAKLRIRVYNSEIKDWNNDPASGEA